MTSDPAVLEQLRAMQEHDVPVRGGRTLAYVYDSGLADADEIGRAAVAAYAGANGLDPTAFPSLLTMENELVGFACDLLDAPESTVGTVTSGGTESVLLAVQTARDAHPQIERPRMVLPATAHAAFHKAAHYFGVEPVVVPVAEDHRAHPDRMASAIDDRTVLVVASAPSYAHGVVDPVTSVAAAAAARGVRCHVDACIGGWVLPYATRLGRPVPAWTFAVDGVTSISVDLHKYAYAPKGTSILLHRAPELRRPQFFASARWPGYTMLNSTMQSTKSGGPLAGAWAVVRQIGDAGYLELNRRMLAGVDALVAAIDRIDALHTVARPDSTLVVFGTDDSCDVFTLTDLLSRAGWYVQPQLSFAGEPPTIHLSVSPATQVDAFVGALRDAVAEAVRVGPAQVSPDIAEFVRALDAATLTDEDFAGLLAAVGMDGDGGLPESMATVNALLDIAAPALREALLTAYLDRLARPVRRRHTVEP
ncbi:pyridoxal phosphate-dependent decarboxylase family protein [Flexivirga oryzae]|uniref:Glutamate/tyrosine decarboxylase-like PLP-dependent enzyme n=1 Tax=Flexivirga oryzae TaxID=1794944 RepID=A0A839N3Z6_9MICO|nr:aminotransferase class V-fold PLP-dependent enzyme [Flexivirga oryzae]MBB2892458.1 glutamate/tyrosine decarboxylase-like PLP-dependent enzyme [Flexivirga oryzae]